MNENKELGSGPLANEDAKGLPVVMWAAFDADGDFADITESIGISHGWARAKGFEIRPLVYQGDALIAIAQRDAELAELRGQNELLKEAGERVDDDYQATISALQAELANQRANTVAQIDAHAQTRAELAAMREFIGKVQDYVDADGAQVFPYAALKAIHSAAPVSAPSQVAAEVVQWIPVVERLPEPNQVVALMNDDIWMNTGSDDFACNWHGAGYLVNNFAQQPYWTVFGEPRGRCLDAATHWAPMPALLATSQGEA